MAASTKRFLKLLATFAILALLCTPSWATEYWKGKFVRFYATAGESLAIGDVVCLSGDDSRAYKADADDSSKSHAVGVVGAAATAGGSVEIIVSGIITGQTPASVGSRIYLDTTAGGMTTTINEWGQVLGTVVGGTAAEVAAKESTTYFISAQTGDDYWELVGGVLTSARPVAIATTHVLTLNCDGVTDHTATINAALSTYSSVKIVKTPGSTGVCIISAPLITMQGGGQKLEVSDDITIRLAVGSNCNMLRNWAAENYNRVTGVSTYGSGNTICPTPGFTTADIGRIVVIRGAGGLSAGAVQWDWSARITEAGATYFAVDEGPPTLVTNSGSTIYALDTDLVIAGGKWDRGNVAGSYSQNHSINLAHMDRFDVGRIYYTSSSGKYAVHVYEAVNGIVHKIGVSSYPGGSDGIHVNGYAKNITIRDIEGATGDDTVALVAMDYQYYTPSAGNIVDVLIENVNGNHSHGGTPHSIVKAISGPSCEIRNLMIRGVHGSGAPPVNLFDDPTIGASTLKNVLVDGVDAKSAQETATGFIVTATCTFGYNLAIRNLLYTYPHQQARYLVDLGRWDQVTIDGVSIDLPSSSTAPILARIAAGKLVKSLNISNLQAQCATGSFVTGLDVVGELQRLNYFNAQLSFPSNTGVLVNLSSGATLRQAAIANVTMTNGRCLFEASNGVTSCPVQIANASLKGTSRMLNNGNSGVSYFLVNVTLDTMTNAYVYTNGGNVDISGSGVYEIGVTKPGVQRNAGTEQIRCYNPDYPLDLSMAKQHPNGAALNTNGALTCGPGRAWCNGTAWKNLYSGATY